MCSVNKCKYKVKIQNYSYYCNPYLFCLSDTKKREPEDEQLCIAVHNIKCSIIPLDNKTNIYLWDFKLTDAYCPT